ncbi:MAG: acyl-CoA thioesterase, partial [Akkermansiaceae bacterium]|nr:acyl-CoA thioesterase [Akkermansiaceae bacterium]
METHRLVLPEDLNQFGYLFGGRLLSWIDEACWIAASLDYPDCQFVTIGMDQVEFRHSVREGTILSIKSEKVKEGESSVSYA